LAIFDIFKKDKGKKIFKGRDVKGILSQLCALREHAVISTSMSNVSVDFVAVLGEEVFVKSSLSREDAIFLLRNTDLTMQFSYLFQSFSGTTRLTGLGLYDNVPVLKFQIPDKIVETDVRYACRVNNIGNIPVTFSYRNVDIFEGRVADISVTGISVLVKTKENIKDILTESSTIVIELSLAGRKLKLQAKVMHIQGKKIGCRFLDIDNDTREFLKNYVTERVEEMKQNLKTVLEKKSQKKKKARQGKRETAGIVVVSKNNELIAKIESALKRKYTVFSSDLSLESVKAAINMTPQLIILHVEDLSIDSVTLAKRIAYIIRSFVPFILVGEGIDDKKKSSLITATGALSYYSLDNFNTLNFFKTVNETIKSIY
jgi:c-di-GMP-binding flagellar brake protein YcgR